MTHLGCIIKRTPITEHLIELTVALDDRGAYAYKAGQYADVAIGTGGNTPALTRLLSFTSAPHEDHVRFIIHTSQSAFKQQLATAPLPLAVHISEPTGVFTLPRPARPKTIVGIADNIGLTPFISIARALAHEPTPHTLTIICHSKRSVPAFAELFTTAGIPYTHTNRDEPLTPALAPHLATADRFYISGKPAFVATTREHLLAAGTQPHTLIEEPFTGY